MSEIDTPANGETPPKRIIDGASGPFAWRPPASDAIVPSNTDAAPAAPTPSQGTPDARSNLRPVQSDRRRSTRRGDRAGDSGGVVRGGPERGLPRPGGADHGVRGGVSDGDLRRGRGEDRDSGPGLGLHPGEGGSDHLAAATPAPAPSPAAPKPLPPSVPAPKLTASPLGEPELERLRDLQKRIGIQFRKQELLREAMTHASWNNEHGEPSGPGHDNERLEYLGDAVLELVVGEYLFRRFPTYDEGQLTQLRAALVNTTSLARLGERLELGETLLMGRGAVKTGARKLPSLLANAFEAMIGAIFLDQGYRAATKVFLQNIGDLAEWSDENFK